MQYIGLDIHNRDTFYTQVDQVGKIQRQGTRPNVAVAGELWTPI